MHNEGTNVVKYKDNDHDSRNMVFEGQNPDSFHLGAAEGRYLGQENTHFAL